MSSKPSSASAATATASPPPPSLGKQSLRRRLEAYYQRVAPEQLQGKNEEAWKDRFDKIWAKFGGTIAGERKLAAKLEKKYGSIVRLQIVTLPPPQQPTTTGGTAVPTRRHASSESQTTTTNNVHNEDYYELTEQQCQSGILSFTDDNFDPHAALRASHGAIVAANPWWDEQTSSSTQQPALLLLERVDQCRSLLPRDDPLFRPATAVVPRNNDVPKVKAPSAAAFAAIAESHKEGPLSILYQAVVRRKRIRVLIRYLDGIRGVVTGHLLAFDKHFNLLLKDAHEVYSPRLGVQQQQRQQDADGGEGGPCPTRAEMEVQRRIRGYAGDGRGEAWSCRQRRMGQILLRGDNVVLVYKPDQEQSSWPATRQSPRDTIYRKQSAKRNVPPHFRVGTPGSLGLTARRRPSSLKTPPSES